MTSDCKDEWKDKELGLCLLQTFREVFGNEAYLEETAKLVSEKRKQAQEILQQNDLTDLSPITQEDPLNDVIPIIADELTMK